MEFQEKTKGYKCDACLNQYVSVGFEYKHLRLCPMCCINLYLEINKKVNTKMSNLFNESNIKKFVPKVKQSKHKAK